MSRLLLLLLLAGTSLFLSSCSSKNRADTPRATAQGGPLVVSGVIVRPEPLDNVVRSSGTVLASESVDLVTEAAGRIEKIYFKEGGHITKDELLVKIVDDDLRAALKK